MPTLKITTEFLATGLVCPAPKRRIEYCDTVVPGLYIEVRSTSEGQGTYYLRYKDPNRKTCHQKIGRTTDIDLGVARDRAKTLRAQIELGANPREAAKAKDAVPTFATFFVESYQPYAKERKRTWAKDESMYRQRLKPVFGAVRLDHITRQRVQAFHTELKQQGLAGATCDHQVKLLRRCLNLAVQWEIIAKNPAAGVALFREDNKVERYLKPEELGRLLHVLRTDTNRTVCNIALFLLSTGARLNEALQAQWKDVDRDHRVWRIPARNAKSGKVRSVPLNDAALAVLDSLTTQKTSAWLFVNTATKQPYTTIHKVWERLRMEAGLPTLRIHDLRHSYASFLVNAGRTLYEVQAILGHADPTVTQRYAHLSTKALQEAADTVGAIIQGTGTGST